MGAGVNPSALHLHLPRLSEPPTRDLALHAQRTRIHFTVQSRVPSAKEGSIIDALMAQVTTAGNNSEGSMLEAAAHEWDLQFYRNYDRK